MLDEKTMVSDALAGVNGELVRYGEMISQTENKELKQKLKQIRNDCEMSQEKLYQIAREKSYYVPAAKATDQVISHVKIILAGISTHLYRMHAIQRTCHWQLFLHTLVSKMHAGTFLLFRHATFCCVSFYLFIILYFSYRE